MLLCSHVTLLSSFFVIFSSLSDIAKHSPELAQTVVDAGAITFLSQHVDTQDSKLKRQVLSALSQVFLRLYVAMVQIKYFQICLEI